MDTKRRTLLATGAAAAAVAATPRAFAQRTDAAGRFFEKGSVRIHYAEAGSGFPLLVIPGGGCQTPVLVMPDDSPPHPYVVAMETVMLAQKSEVSLFPWKDPKDRIPVAVRQVRSFLRAHGPLAA